MANLILLGSLDISAECSGRLPSARVLDAVLKSLFTNPQEGFPSSPPQLDEGHRSLM